MSRILIVLSGSDTWTRADGTEYPTGYWAEELVVPHEKFVGAGHTVDIATPEGRKPTLDPHSVDRELVGQDEARRFTAYLESIAGLWTPHGISRRSTSLRMTQWSFPAATARWWTFTRTMTWGRS